VIWVGYSIIFLITLEVGLRFADLVISQSRNLALARQDEHVSSSNEFRILAIGESTAYGLGVGRDDAYPAQLERLLNEQTDTRFDVIDTGVPGQTSTSILRSIAYQMQRYAPHVVICQFGINDTNEALNALSSRVVFGFYVPQFITNLRTYRLACLVRDFILYTPKTWKDGAWTFYDPTQREADGMWIHDPLYRDQLVLNYHEIIEVIHSYGVPVVVVSYLRSGPWLRATLKRIADQNGTAYVDLFFPRVDSLGFFIKDRFHPNKQGHQFIAEAILEALRVHQLIPLPR
jgi:lysophospholipase L1-like esterase